MPFAQVNTTLPLGELAVMRRNHVQKRGFSPFVTPSDSGNRETSAQVRAWYPDGVPEGELDALHARLTVRSGLRVVAGGAS